MSSIWNPQDRYILANGAVSANAPLSGDGSNSQPLGLDLKTDNSLSGNGTLTSPLGLNETLLYSAASNTNNTAGQVFIMSESVLNFERIRITCDNMEFQNRPFTQEYPILTSSCVFNSPIINGNIPPSVNIPYVRYNINASGNLVCYARGLIYNTWTAIQTTSGDNRGYCLRQVVGINRKQ